MTNPLYAIVVALALAAAGPVSAAAAESTAAKDPAAAKGAPAAAEDDTFDKHEMLAKAEEFFGSTTKGLAEAIQKVFEDQGRPNGYIKGEEVSGAFGVGLRYGNGKLHRKTRAPMQLYWQGPSVGFDFGGNASKVFTLVYHLKDNEEIFQRIPGAEGTLYVVAGVAVNYQQSGDLILAPIRTGVGLRGGVNVGYLHYAKKHSWIPF
ncbi:MAG: DUF1134 domain-containing protein [Rhodospirillales bacterium]